MSETVISFSELCGPVDRSAAKLSDPYRNLLEYADVVAAEEPGVRSRTVIFGRQALQNVVVPSTTRQLSIVVVTIDTDEGAQQFQRLCSVVQSVKGRHECSPEDRIKWREQLLTLLAQTEQAIAEVKATIDKNDANDRAINERPSVLADLQKAEFQIQMLLGDGNRRNDRNATPPRDN